jgi:bifunctional non-homologous end joining protein LigD
MAGHRRAGDIPAGQLALAMDEAPTASRLPDRIVPMVATAGEAPFDDEDYLFEPWWPGTRAFAFVDQGRLRLQTEHLTDPLATFPELGVIVDQLDSDGVVLEGTLLVLDEEGRPDAELLRRRLGGTGTEEGEAAFVASDVLWVDGIDITGATLEDRRARLGTLLSDSWICVAGPGLRGEGTTLAEAVASMGLEAISARSLAATYRPGSVGDDWLRLPVVEPPAPETRPLLVLLSRLPLD